VIDTPGADDALSRLAHSYADTVITPMNDSFVDFDLLAKVDPETYRILRPSFYSEMVWEQKKRRAMRDGGSIDWIVMRNRLASTEAKNKRAVGQVLDQLAKRIGFRVAPGFGDRVIFRELFLQGLTLLDLREPGLGRALNMSHVAARQEVRDLLGAVGIEAAQPSNP
jgi:chromosome partitioning protein